MTDWVIKNSLSSNEDVNIFLEETLGNEQFTSHLKRMWIRERNITEWLWLEMTSKDHLVPIPLPWTRAPLSLDKLLQVPTNLALNTYQLKERLNSGKPKRTNGPCFRKNILKISDDLCAAAVSTPILAFSFNE